MILRRTLIHTPTVIHRDAIRTRTDKWYVSNCQNLARQVSEPAVPTKMITEKLSLKKHQFPPLIWGAVISYLVSAIFLHSSYPEILEFAAKTGFLIVLLFYLKKISVYRWIPLKSDIAKAVKYFAGIVLGGIFLISFLVAAVAIGVYLFPTVAYLEHTLNAPFSEGLFPPAYSSPVRTVFYLATVCVIAPLAEEIFFRRFLFVYLRKTHTKSYSIAVSSMIFGAVHFEGFVIAAGIGAVLAYIYEKEERLAIPVMIHSMKNTVAIIAGLAYQYWV